MQSVRSGFQLNVGLVTVPVNLYSVVPSDKGRKTKLLCKQHTTPINQVYKCPEDDELSPEVVKGYEVTKGSFAILEEEEVAKVEFDKDNGIDIVAVPTDDVNNFTVPGTKMYYLEPHKTAAKPWEILFRLAQDKKRTLVGQTAIRKNNRALYRLSIFNDYLVMQELQFPEHVRSAPEHEHVRIEKKLMDQAKKVLDAIEIDWGSFAPEDEMLAKFRELALHSDTVNVDTTSDSGEVTNVIDLMDALKASVDATKRKAE